MGASSAKSHPCRRRILATVLVAGVCCATVWWFRAELFIRLANAWVVNNPPAKADAIVVLGGGLQTRPFAAAALYHQGFAPKILVMTTKADPTDRLGLTFPETEITTRTLLHEGVPASAVTVLTNVVWSTHDETEAVRQWAVGAKPRRILIPTDLFHTRRVAHGFKSALKTNHVEVLVQAVPQRRYSHTNWWHVEEGLIDFQNEVVKSLYYQLKY